MLTLELPWQSRLDACPELQHSLSPHPTPPYWLPWRRSEHTTGIRLAAWAGGFQENLARNKDFWESHSPPGWCWRPTWHPSDDPMIGFFFSVGGQDCGSKTWRQASSPLAPGASAKPEHLQGCFLCLSQGLMYPRMAPDLLRSQHGL